MADDPVKTAEKAALAAREAAAAAQRESDAKELEFFQSVQTVQQLKTGPTATDDSRRMSRFISRMGFDAFQHIMGNSRPRKP